MGNANCREEGCANGGGGGDEALGILGHSPNERVNSFDLMLSSPPHDHRQSRSPLFFSSQAPVDPLRRDNGPSFNPSRQNGSQRAVDHSFEQGMPIVISWSFGGNIVSVEGSWDNWSSRRRNSRISIYSESSRRELRFCTSFGDCRSVIFRKILRILITGNCVVKVAQVVQLWVLEGKHQEVPELPESELRRFWKILQRSCKDHSILLVLPPGIYCYRFIVDGEVKYAPGLPCDADEMGRHCNLLDVNNCVPENLDSVAEFEAPPSSDSSYSQAFPGDEDFAKDPMLVPPQLKSSVLGSDNCKETFSSSKPQHVELNHLFVEKGVHLSLLLLWV